jgi:eukaryotic-like serine/threonine-protein kinase
MGETSPESRIGATLAGKYRLDRIIGEGGMGVVYGATHLRLRQQCAIKLLNERAIENQDIVGRFEREARAAATLKNEHVVQVLDVDTTSDGIPYMVMEFLEGRDLATVLDENGPLPVEQAVRWSIATCAALAHAHKRGVIHRDLKPSNLFLSEKEGEITLKLLDFGISKLTTEEEVHVTSSIAMFGTPFYMSPEQVRSVRDVDGRTDIWSLGVVLYELLTGRVPFKGVPSAVCAAIVADPVTPPRTLRPDIPEPLEAVILKALEKDRARRFGDVRELAMELAPFAEGVAVSEMMKRAARVSLPEITVAAKRSSPTLAYARTQVESPIRIPSLSATSAGTAVPTTTPTSRPPPIDTRTPIVPLIPLSPPDSGSSGRISASLGAPESASGETMAGGAWSARPQTSYRRRSAVIGVIAGAVIVAIAAIAVTRGRTAAPERVPVASAPRETAAAGAGAPDLAPVGAQGIGTPIATVAPSREPAQQGTARARGQSRPATPTAPRPSSPASVAPAPTASPPPPATKPQPPTLSNPLTL